MKSIVSQGQNPRNIAILFKQTHEDLTTHIKVQTKIYVSKSCKSLYILKEECGKSRVFRSPLRDGASSQPRW